MKILNFLITYLNKVIHFAIKIAIKTRINKTCTLSVFLLLADITLGDVLEVKLD